MIAEYKTFWFKERKTLRRPEMLWINTHRHIEKTMVDLEKSIEASVVKEVINCTENNSSARTYTLNGLTNLLAYFGIKDYDDIIQDFKKKNKPKPKDRNVPSDKKIELIYRNGFTVKPSCPKINRYRYPQWQFLYSILAIYGLRILENTPKNLTIPLPSVWEKPCDF